MADIKISNRAQSELRPQLLLKTGLVATLLVIAFSRAALGLELRPVGSEPCPN